MGYRSQVGIKCQKNGFEKFKAAYEAHNFEPDEIYVNADKSEYLLYWDWVKWYDNFDCVKAINKIMNELDELDESDAWDQGLAYKMIRLGEDYDDTEIQCNSYDIELWIAREIDKTDMRPLKKGE